MDFDLDDHRLGGRADEQANIGSITGPAFSRDDIAGAVDQVIATYLDHRQDGEIFIDTYQRIGPAPFKEDLYGSDQG